MKNRVIEVLSKYWGYNSFKPFQEEAILSILDLKDTLTVLPTGGGKSVCFQAPALICEGMAVIISPLISLMKDQVDYLKDIGVDAECLNSSLTASTQQNITSRIISNKLKLLYISPERLLMPDVRQLLKSVKISFFVIDEAHCISQWGHDFRAEYRKLSVVKDEFKGINVHAFTATATEEVQKDIVSQLKLDSPRTFIGNIDRPNLVYRVMPRSGNLISHVVSTIKKHENEPGIIYCLRRADVDELSAKLNELGYKNLPYHAGMIDKDRKTNQEEFSSERIPIIVATIAFGMGIDRSNIRYIIHAALPKSIEHYQQETGRAGRDGLPSDCYMFYSWADYKVWEHLLRDSPQKYIMLQKLRALYDFCVYPRCRHRYLAKYFGHNYEKDNCQACDYCLGEVTVVENPLEIAQKILSCVIRVKEKFGAEHVVNVLKGDATDKITKWGHDKLSTFSIMKDETKVFIRYMIEQLVGQEYLTREDEFSTLSLSETGHKLLKGEVTPVLAKPIVGTLKKEIDKKRKAKRTQEWEGVDKKLFELLRKKRSELAQQKNVPAYIIFSDKTLQDIASKKPASLEQFLNVFGIGEVKLTQYGQSFLDVVRGYLQI